MPIEIQDKFCVGFENNFFSSNDLELNFPVFRPFFPLLSNLQNDPERKENCPYDPLTVTLEPKKGHICCFFGFFHSCVPKLADKNQEKSEKIPKS
jgi:hypothetical protein